METLNQIENLVGQGKFDEASELLNNGEKFNKDYLKNNFTQVAAKIIEARRTDFVKELIKGGFIETDIYELDKFDDSIFNPLSRYLKNDDESVAFFKEVMSEMENINDEINDQTLLGYLLSKGTAPLIIKSLIDDFSASATFKNNAGENLIHLVLKTFGRKEEVVKEYISILVDNGADINEKNIAGTTALIAAVQKNKKDLIEFLLENGADPNETDNRNNTAFYYAVAEQFSPELYTALATVCTPDFTILNNEGESLFTNFLNSISGSETELTFLEKLLSDGADLNFATDYYGQPKSGLDYIAEKKADVLKKVLENASIEINEQDNKGNTLLHKVCAYDVNYDANMAKETYKKVKLLLDHGADISITNDKDQTALMLASEDNLKIKTVELLMKQ
jgi:ankyrin repeat protein